MANEEENKTPAVETAKAEKAGGGSGTLAVILSVVNLILILGIGAVVFLQFQKDKHKESVADIQANAPAAEAANTEGHGEHGAEGKAAPKANAEKIVTLEQFTVNLSTSVGMPPRFARVVIAVEVPSEDTSQELNQKMPQVRNAIIDLFNSKRPADLQNGEGRNYLREEIRNALNSFLITGKIKGVFFSNFAISS